MHFNTTKEETMKLLDRLAIESSHVYPRLRRILMLLLSKDFRTRNRYYEARMQVTTDAFLQLVQSGEVNPAYAAPGADQHVVSRYTPATLAAYHLGKALADARLSIDFLAYSNMRGYEEGKRTAEIELRRDMAQVAKYITEARLHTASFESLIKQHPWAEFYLTS